MNRRPCARSSSKSHSRGRGGLRETSRMHGGENMSKAGKVKAVPAGYHSVTPYLIVDGAARALDFYKRVFGATEKMRMPGPDGKIGHAEITIGDSMIMPADEHPDMGARGPPAV